MNKKRSISFLLAGVIIAVLLLCMALPAYAKATRIEVATFDTYCGAGIEKQWMEGNVLHIRNYIHYNPTESDTPELNGINYTVADADINLLTGVRVIRGTTSLHPETIDGTWEGTWTSISTPGVIRGYAVAHGTGALFGKTLYLKLYGAYDPSTASKCAGLGEYEGNGFAEGYILDAGVP